MKMENQPRIVYQREDKYKEPVTSPPFRSDAFVSPFYRDFLELQEILYIYTVYVYIYIYGAQLYKIEENYFWRLCEFFR